MTYVAMQLLGFPDGTASDPFGADAQLAGRTGMYVALVTGALMDLHRGRRQRQNRTEPMTWRLDPARIGAWFCDSAREEGHALWGVFESANWVFRSLDRILSQYASDDIVFVAHGRSRDATAELIGALAEQRQIALNRRAGEPLAA